MSERSPELEGVFEHLRGVAERARAAAIGRDMAGFRAAIAQFGALSDATTETTAPSVPVDAGGVPCEWTCAEGSDPKLRLLYIHGGSWMAGRPSEYRPLLGRISAATGCSVLAVDYRLAPEDKFPAGLEDCLTAYRWLRENGPESAGPPTRIFIAGDSAGGNLTLVSSLSLRDAGERLPDAVVAISPATDFTGSGESAVSRREVDPIIDAGRVGSTGKGYYGDRDPRDPMLSPLFAELEGLPPMLLQVGDAETLLDDSVRFAEKARSAGVDATLEVWPEMPHVWHVFAPVLGQATEAIESIGAFVRARCGDAV